MTSRKKAKSTEPKAKKEKKAKDPNAPKRPPTAFFLFLYDLSLLLSPLHKYENFVDNIFMLIISRDDFRKEYKEANPDCKSVKEV